MIQKVLKLLELGNEEKNSQPHERENAKRMAAKLMAEYSLEFADLKANIKKDGSFIKLEVEGAEGVKVNWEFSLAGNVANVFDCKVIGGNTWKGIGQTWSYSFLGTKGDLDVAIFFFQYLRRTVGKMSESKFPNSKNKANTYAFGMTMTLRERLNDLFARRDEFIPADCKDLMVLKHNELANYVKEQYPHLRNSKLSVGKDHAAFSAGKEDGRRISLSRPISNNGGSKQNQLTVSL